PLTVGQEYDAPNGIVYTWDGVAWVAAPGTTAPLWSDRPSDALMSPTPPDRSLSLAPDSAIHFGDPSTSVCPCIESDGDDLTCEVPGVANVEIAGAIVATFDGDELSVAGRLVSAYEVQIGPVLAAPAAGAISFGGDGHFRGYTGAEWAQLDGVVGAAA